jgi:putative serine/threonine protein kinase
MIDEKRLEKIKECLKGYDFFEFIARGKRGEVYRISNTLIAKIQRDDTDAVNSIKNEYDTLKKLEKYDFFPKAKLCNEELKFIIMDYVKGKTIGSSLDKKLFIKTLSLARALDMEKINQQELTNPYKHIYFYEGKAKMIDFERARFSNNPKNVTQFAQYLCKRFGIGYKKITPLMIEYKKNNSENCFKKIIKILKELMQ